MWLLSPSICYAQSTLPVLSDGTELIVTDEASEVILGYGTVRSGRLELNLSATTATMVVLFINPNGSFTTLRGYVGEDRRLWLTDEAMQVLTNLETLSQTANLALDVSGVAADAFVAGDDDDDRLRPPDQLAQPATRPADSTGNSVGNGAARSSQLGIDLADQDDGNDDDRDDDRNRDQTSVSRQPNEADQEEADQDVSTPSVSVDSPPEDNADIPSAPATPATPDGDIEAEVAGDDVSDEDNAEGDAETDEDSDTEDGDTEDSDAENSDTENSEETDDDEEDGDAENSDGVTDESR